MLVHIFIHACSRHPEGRVVREEWEQVPRVGDLVATDSDGPHGRVTEVTWLTKAMRKDGADCDVEVVAKVDDGK